MIIQIIGDLDPRRLDLLRGGVEPGDVVRSDSDKHAANPPEVVFVWAQRRDVLVDLLDRSGPALRWVHFRRVGIPDSTLKLFDAFPRVQVTTGSGASGVAVAEHALALLLALLKRLPELSERQRQHTWEREFPASDLHGQTACIVGVGDVGVHVARLLRAFGVRTLGVRRRAAGVAEVDETYAVDGLSGALERSTVLVLAATLTPETRHLIGAAELGRLPAGALVINVGRGAVLDEPALVAALQRGHVAGAGLDVLEEEPLPGDSPLWDLPNVIVTPHSAAHTQGTDDRSVGLFLSRLERFRRGD